MLDYVQEDFEEQILNSLVNPSINEDISLKETPLYHLYTKKYEKGQYRPFAIELTEANMYAPIMLFPYGNFSHPVYGELRFNDKFFTEIMDNFTSDVRKIKPFIDERHDEGKALGWITYLYLDEKGMWADVDWNEDGINLIKKGSYKYISPWFGDYVDEQSGKKYSNVLYGAALTNRPFLKVMPPIQLSEDGKSNQGECDIYYFDDLESQVSEKINLNKIIQLVESFNNTKDKEIKKVLKMKILDYLNFTKGGEIEKMAEKEKEELQKTEETQEKEEVKSEEIQENEETVEEKQFPIPEGVDEDKVKECVGKISGINEKTGEPYTDSEKWAICVASQQEKKEPEEEVKKEPKEESEKEEKTEEILEEIKTEEKETSEEEIEEPVEEKEEVKEKTEELIEESVEEEKSTEEEVEESIEEVDEKEKLLQEKDREILELKVDKLLSKKLADNKILSEPAKKIIREILLAENSKEIKLEEGTSIDLLSAFNKLFDEVLVIDISSKLEEETEKNVDIDKQYDRAIRKIQKEHKCDYLSAMEKLSKDNPELMKKALRE